MTTVIPSAVCQEVAGKNVSVLDDSSVASQTKLILTYISELVCSVVLVMYRQMQE